MKLKKILSLAAAGVMAVSMLTACGSNTIDEQPPVDNGGDTTPAAGYSATFEGRLSAGANANISMSDSADLNAALKYAMDFAADNHIAWDYNWNHNNTVQFVNPKGGSDLGVVATELIKKADSKKEGIVNSWVASTAVEKLLPVTDDSESMYYKNDDVDVVMLYVVDGGLSTDAAVMEVADDLNEDIENLTRIYQSQNQGGTPDSGKHTATQYTYTGSVSADTITLDANHGKSVTFVAVEIVRELA